MSNRGESTRQRILQSAAEMASLEGLEGLTIGRVAEAVKLSKAGLFAHFGSKEELQLATIERAREIFLEEIVTPNQHQPAGLGRLRAHLESWIAYVERGIFPGGCFFAAAGLEFDGRPGRVRERVAFLSRQWMEVLDGDLRQAIRLGEVDPAADPRQICFELHALVQEANWAHQLLGDRKSYERARAGIEARLSQVSLTSHRGQAPNRPINT